jgi:hypothetical protein
MRRQQAIVTALLALWIGCSPTRADDGNDAPAAGGHVDPVLRSRFPEFFPDEVPHSIPLDEIVHGGPPKDGIPALTRPSVVPARQADYLRDDDIVLGVERNGEARAYPLRILNWHEIVNDVLGGDPIVVTFCPLCGTGIVFDPRIGGAALEFGVSGLLHNSDLLMYDRRTDTPSLWQQALGQAVVGPRTGQRLAMLPAVQTRWADWTRRHPETTALSTETGYGRDYGRDPYAGYALDSRLFFAVKGERPDLPRKALVFGLVHAGQARAYPVDALAKEPVVHDRVGGERVVVLTESEGKSVRAYRAGMQRFLPRHDGATVADTNGTNWTITEAALIGPEGTRLDRIETGFVSFWFAWSAFYPQSDVFRGATADGTRPDRWGRVKKESLKKDADEGR